MNRDGFSLIEIIVGMLIFAVGFMALSASTAFVSSQIQAADVRTERNVAYQQVTERLHALPFDSVKTIGSPQTVGSYAFTWDVQSVSWALKQVQLISTGPGFEGGKRVASAADTLTIRIARPIQ